MRTPVAFLIFNRPETTARVFAEIRRARPEQLLVVADGPRAERSGEAEKCAAARAVVSHVDWDCEVLTNFSDVNLGCKMRVSSGLDWVFKTVEEAIIVEDDCLPHPTFFRFCEELLARYRDDQRVMAIAGASLLGNMTPDIQSYHFSYYGGIWGWASWRRAWKFYDRDIKLWPEVLEARVLENLFPTPSHCSYWKTIFQQLYEGTINTWDYQWLLACWINSGLRIFPAVNLISNIGFGITDATHTSGESLLPAIPEAGISFPLKHPRFIVRNEEADNLLSEQYYSLQSSPALVPRLKAKISKTLRLS
jgi:hypothetical protein